MEDHVSLGQVASIVSFIVTILWLIDFSKPE